MVKCVCIVQRQSTDSDVTTYNNDEFDRFLESRAHDVQQMPMRDAHQFKLSSKLSQRRRQQSARTALVLIDVGRQKNQNNLS